MSARHGLLLLLLSLPGATLAAQAVSPVPAPDDATPGASAAGAAAPAAAYSTDYPVEVPAGSRLLGERFELLVRGPLTSGDRLDIPAPPPGVEVGAGRIESTLGGPVLHQPLRVTREGDFRLEDLHLVTGEKRVPLPPVELHVVLDLPAGHVPQVAAALPPVTLPGIPRWAIVTGLGLGAAMVLLGWWLWRRRRDRAPQQLAPPRPAADVAAEALARLRLRLPRTEEDVPPFLTEVSDVLRAYIEQRFGVHAPESTTEEFLSVVAQRHDALASRRDALGDFLTRCDLVKFARHRPEPGFALPLLEVAERFVADTRPAPEPAAGVTGEAA